MLDRLRDGHEPDEHGWCAHTAHTHRWEQHPCFTRRLADLAAGPEGLEPPDLQVAEPEAGAYGTDQPPKPRA